MKLTDFSLLKEDTENYTIGHPKGKSLTVPKKGLSEKAQKLISQLKKHQNFDAGSEPIGEDVSEPAQDNLSDIIPKELVSSEANPAQESEQLPQASSNSLAAESSANPEIQSPAQPQTAGIAAPDIGQALNKEEASIEGALGQEKALGKQKAQAFTEAAQALPVPDKGSLKNANDLYNEFQVSDKKFLDAIPKIDPNRYLKNQSTLSKIASGIGLALSGFGSSLTGAPNLALQHLNAAIGRDIESQSQDQTKAMNLWKMNRDHYGDAVKANLATQNQLLTIAQYKAQAAAAQAPSADSQARLAQVIGGIDQQKAMNNWMLSRSSGGPAGSEQQHVSEMGIMQRLNPALYKDMQSKYIPSVGIARTPVAEADRQALKTYADLDASIKRAKNFALTEGTTAPLTAKNAEADAIRQDLVTGFQTLHDLKRLSDVDLKYNLSNISSPGAFRTQAAVAQFDTLAKELATKQKTEYNQLGITPFAKAQNEQTAAAWARANPNDPRSKAILQTLQQKNGNVGGP